MDYLRMIQTVPAYRTALIEDSVHYTYGKLVQDAEQLRSRSFALKPSLPVLNLIEEPTVYLQLVRFLSCDSKHIPVILPPDIKCQDKLSSTPIPTDACMGVLTSGTTGTPKIWFRTFESWHSFFPVQNQIFSVSRGTRMFIHGSLAFTGNLNMILALLSEGACVITSTPVHPPAWNRSIMDYKANSIYLIPSKLRLLARTAPAPADNVKTILSGSQSLGLHDIRQIKAAYPSSHCILYYGASELSYVSYLPDSMMNSDMSCVGTPFPGIKVTVQQDEIVVDTPYSALGINGPYSVGDMGFFDRQGLLYLLGRKDNVYNIHGRKVPAALVENALLSLDEVNEAAVIMEKESLTAYVVLNSPCYLPDPAASYSETAMLLMARLKPLLEPWLLPRRIILKKELPKNNSGKLVSSKLSADR